jgi:hypothetical protein
MWKVCSRKRLYPNVNGITDFSEGTEKNAKGFNQFTSFTGRDLNP